MSYSAYPEYKNSGADWLGEIPSQWQLAPLWSLFRREKRVGFQEEELLSVYRDYGVIPKSSREDNFNKPSDDLGTYQLVDVGDLAINKMKAWQGSVAISGCRGIVSPAYHVYAKEHQMCDRYLHHLFRSREYTAGYMSNSKGIRVNQWDLEPQQHSRMPVLLPSLEEQTQIARFLDHETARIDALIEEQQRLIELLKEKLRAIISHAVTKGLDPTVPMKDSGVEWLGDVPEHWSVGFLKHTLESVADVDHYMPNSVDSGVPYVMTGDLRRYASEIDLSSCKQITHQNFLKLTRKIRTSKGDVIMARYATIGTVSYVDVDAEFIVSYSCVTIRPRTKLASGAYLFFYFQSDAFIQGISIVINANTQDNVGIGDLKEVIIALPDILEQKAIIDALEVKLTKLDALVDEAKSSIGLMRERRSAIISAAVTGKIDVRDWQPDQSSATNTNDEYAMVAEPTPNYR